ncbi:MAG: alpha/beta fold hydrolase [Promethearchaeota archaeon]
MAEEYITIRGIKLFIQYRNLEKHVDFNKINQSQIPIIVQHGHTANHFFMRPIFDYLADKGYPVIAFDWRGHGWSQKDLSGKYTIDECVQDLHSVYEQFLKTRGYLKFNLLGHSMGGMIVLKYAVNYPDTLNKLVILASSARPAKNFLYKIAGVLMFLKYKYSYQKVLASKKEGHIQLGIENFPQWEDTTLLPDPKASLEFIKSMIKFDVSKELKNIKVPTYVVVGSNDSLKNMSKWIADNIPNAEFELIEGLVHNLQIHGKEIIPPKIEDFVYKKS